MFRLLLVVLGCAALAAPSATHAQDRWRLDLRPAAALPTEDLADASLGTGFGAEANVAFRLQQHLSVYAGWSWFRFTSDASFAGTERDFEETGYPFGLRFQYPVGGSESVAIRLHGGGTYNHIEVEDGDGELVVDSGHGLGWEAGIALAIRAGRGWELVPGARFRALTRDFTVGSTTTTGSLRYLALELGFSRTF